LLGQRVEVDPVHRPAESTCRLGKVERNETCEAALPDGDNDPHGSVTPRLPWRGQSVYNTKDVMALPGRLLALGA
jgi:hypothetical protein